jgi:hypothetical protein
VVKSRLNMCEALGWIREEFLANSCKASDKIR